MQGKEQARPEPLKRCSAKVRNPLDSSSGRHYAGQKGLFDSYQGYPGKILSKIPLGQLDDR